MILRFKPISKCFQSPKHVIKAKDLRLTLIDITVPKFLTEPLLPAPKMLGCLLNLQLSCSIHTSRQFLLTRSGKNQSVSPPKLIQRKTLRYSIGLTPRTLLIPIIVLVLLLKSAPIKKHLIFLKEWCSRKRRQTCWPYLQLMLGGMLLQCQLSLGLLLQSHLIPLPHKQLRRKGRQGNRPGMRVLRRGRYPHTFNSHPLRSQQL